MTLEALSDLCRLRPASMNEVERDATWQEMVEACFHMMPPLTPKDMARWEKLRSSQSIGTQIRWDAVIIC